MAAAFICAQRQWCAEVPGLAVSARPGPPGFADPKSPDPAPLHIVFSRGAMPTTQTAQPYDEMLDAAGVPRSHCRHYWTWLDEQADERLAQKRAEADALFHRVGITFAVYGENAGTERLIPFDIVPRILPANEWSRLESGIRQRVRALNAFVADIYHRQEILKAGVIAPELILC